ncbi:MAG: cytochrome c nitrite reductase small subunit [Phototrophicales bacterium]|nr:MAG: cytochrome c nitrite reductase small subunit [Phototrophicales bacterium]
MLGILAGLSIFTFSYARGTSYFSDDPSACMNCHIMRDQYEAWQRSSHRNVATCNDCHTPHEFLDKWIIKGLNGFNHSVAFTLGNFHEPIQIHDLNARVAQHNCVRCHETLVSQVYELHADPAMRCTSCHGSVGHRVRD